MNVMGGTYPAPLERNISAFHGNKTQPSNIQQPVVMSTYEKVILDWFYSGTFKNPGSRIKGKTKKRYKIQFPVKVKTFKLLTVSM